MRFRQRVTLAHAESLPLPITLVEHPRERSQCGKPAAKGTHRCNGLYRAPVTVPMNTASVSIATTSPASIAREQRDP